MGEVAASLKMSLSFDPTALIEKAVCLFLNPNVQESQQPSYKNKSVWQLELFV